MRGQARVQALPPLLSQAEAGLGKPFPTEQNVESLLTIALLLGVGSTDVQTPIEKLLSFQFDLSIQQ